MDAARKREELSKRERLGLPEVVNAARRRNELGAARGERCCHEEEVTLGRKWHRK
jgi:hypothetical protein